MINANAMSVGQLSFRRWPDSILKMWVYRSLCGNPFTVNTPLTHRSGRVDSIEQVNLFSGESFVVCDLEGQVTDCLAVGFIYHLFFEPVLRPFRIHHHHNLAAGNADCSLSDDVDERPGA